MLNMMATDVRSVQLGIKGLWAWHTLGLNIWVGVSGTVCAIVAYVLATRGLFLFRRQTGSGGPENNGLKAMTAMETNIAAETQAHTCDVLIFVWHDIDTFLEFIQRIYPHSSHSQWHIDYISLFGQVQMKKSLRRIGKIALHQATAKRKCVNHVR